MKSIAKLFMIMVCCCASKFFAFGPKISDLKFITEEYPPYNFKKDGLLQGIFVDTLLLMLKSVDPSKSRNSIKLYPWARGYYCLQADKNTVLFATSQTEERLKKFKWVGPLISDRDVIIAPKYKKIKISSFDDLLKYRIGTIREDVSEQLLVSKGYPKGLLKPVSKAYMNAKKIEYGRIDMWAYGENASKWVLKENGIDPDKYEVVYVVSKGAGNYYAFNNNVQDVIIKNFQDSLTKLKKATFKC